MQRSMSDTHYILTLSCADARGIVARVTGFLAEHGGFIVESTQFGDSSTQRFFMRVHFIAEEKALTAEQFKAAFVRDVAEPFGMDWQMVDAAAKPRVLILVSKQLHCLNDLLYRVRTGRLKMEIPAIVSNHTDARGIVEWSGIPFHHIPTDGGKKLDLEQRVRELMVSEKIDLVILARYMQILSPELCSDLRGKVINIHHSFLPSFKGAKPYHQAYERGVKLIGAMAHFVTDDLDEGPIIDQEVARVDHSYSPESLVNMGQDIEALVLARAVTYFTERRLLLNGHKTVVFR